MRLNETPLAEDPIPEFLALPSAENTDWGYARTKRAALMVPSAEWVQSVFSCPVSLNWKTLILPNRDFPYEGLMVYQDGENWKFIDSIGLGVQGLDQVYMPLESPPSPDAVKLNPWRSTYRYQVLSSNGRLPVSVSYYLHSLNSPMSIGGCVEFYFPQGLHAAGDRLVPVIQPFVDIRHMYGPSNFANYWVRAGEEHGVQRVHLTNYNRTLTFYFTGADLELFDRPELLHWYYKLGTGSRTEKYFPEPATVFSGEEKDIAGWFRIRPRLAPGAGLFRLFFTCGLEDAPPGPSSFAEIQTAFARSREKDLEDYRRLQDLFPLSARPAIRNAIHARIAGLTKFKTYVQLEQEQEWVKVPQAGAWWFKTAWYRDVFEGLLNSFETLVRLPGEAEGIRQIVSLALSRQDPLTGRILNRIPEYKHLDRSYNASDATLLCFVVGNRYVEKTGEVDFARQVLHGVEKVIDHFQGSEAAVDGPPRVDTGSGLLLSVPHHSWMDTRSQRLSYDGMVIEGLPNRVSKSFLVDLARLVGKDANLGSLLASPHFFFPEVNAQWIVMLRGTIRTADFLLSKSPGSQEGDRFLELKETAGEILTRAEQHFKPVFWNPENGFLYNVVYKDQSVKDRIETEPGLVAAAMLGETVFTLQELASIWDRVRTELLEYRRTVLYGQERAPFAVIAKNDGQHVFYHDDQYHSDVIWLRSTPYLIQLLKDLGHEEEVEKILLNTLDHQMSEGAIFYNHELLARPLGNNPWGEEATHHNPVPVKNPIQFWSQWCDAYRAFFEGRSA